MTIPLVEHAPPVRVMALHALAYCKRLFYLEEVEEIRVADAAVYAGRELHASLEADADGEPTQLELTDPAIGLVGKVDALRRRDGSPPTKHPIREIDSLLVHGYAQVTTQAINLCVDRDVPVHWLTTSGRHVASLTATAGQVQRRVRQYRALADEATCLRLAKALVRAKVEGQHRYLLRASRGDAEAREDLRRDLTPIRSALAFLDTAPDRDSLRGYEGSAAVGYFHALGGLLSASVPESLRYSTRTRRPPLDRFNALLGFGYGLLHTAVMRAVLASGLEPSLGFFHTPRSAAYPLVLDLMELFRVPLWDIVQIGSLNRGQWDPVGDFVATKGKVWLSEEGRRKAIGLFEARLDETWKHPVIGYSLSYVRTLELEARLLEKEWSGEPGLFARLRLR